MSGLWRQGLQALRRAEESGFRTGAPPVWAHSAGQREIAYGLPGDNATRTFRFAPGVEAYGELVSKPGLSAIVTVDRETCHIMGVRFLNVSRT